ncbi:unnamed protein product [Urochloa decumbens]|uniref:Uncharacterized protein n=1 Tax=Urochloa decumbens TaxID=240449 RepID=A0ABC9H8G8_9POAL
MGSVLCSFVKAQLEKADVRRLMALYPHLRDLPAEKREDQLRWLMGKDVVRQHPHRPEVFFFDSPQPEVDPRQQEIEFKLRHDPCRYTCRPCAKVDGNHGRCSCNLVGS